MGAIAARARAGLRRRRGWVVAALAVAGLGGWLALRPGGPPVRARLGPGLPLAFSPDGATLVTWNPSGAVVLWDVASGRPRASFPHRDGAESAAFSPDGQWLAVVGSSPRGPAVVTAFDPGAGRELARLDVAGKFVWELRFLADGATLGAVAFEPGAVAALRRQSWDTATWTEGERAEVPYQVGDLAAFAPDGRTTYVGSATRPEVAVREVATGRRLRTLGADRPSWITDLEPSPDGRRLAIGRKGGAWRSGTWRPAPRG